MADSEASGYEGKSARTLGQDKDRLIRKKKKRVLGVREGRQQRKYKTKKHK